MNRPTPISPTTHGILDYTTSSAVALAPRLLKLPARAAAFSYGLAAGLAGLTLMTRTPVGVKKLIPFKAHGAADAVVGAALPLVPRMLGLTSRSKQGRKARYFFYGLAGMIGTMALATNWNSSQART